VNGNIVLILWFKTVKTLPKQVLQTYLQQIDTTPLTSKNLAAESTSCTVVASTCSLEVYIKSRIVRKLSAVMSRRKTALFSFESSSLKYGLHDASTHLWATNRWCSAMMVTSQNSPFWRCAFNVCEKSLGQLAFKSQFAFNEYARTTAKLYFNKNEKKMF